MRQLTGTGRDATTALALLRAGRWFGLLGRGVRVDIDELRHLDTGAILHWNFNHFVVFERLSRRGVDIVDPGRGRRNVSMDEFRRSFTGVAVLFEPGNGFQSSVANPLSPWRHVKRYIAGWGPLLQLLLLSGLIQLLTLASPAIIGLIVDQVVPREDMNLVWTLGAGLLVAALFFYLASFLRSHLLLTLRTSVDKRLTLGFLEHLVHLPYTFFQVRTAGDLLMRTNSNAAVREILTSSSLAALLDGTLVLSYLFILFAFSPQIGVLAVGISILQLCILGVSRRRYQDLTADLLEAQARSQGYLVQLLQGIETLKATGTEDRAIERWSHLFTRELNASLNRGHLSALTDSVIRSFGLFSPLVVLFVGTIQVLNGKFTLGTLLFLYSLAGGFLAPMSGLMNTAWQLQVIWSYIARLNDVLDQTPERGRERKRVAPRQTGGVTLSSVSFRYSPTSPDVLQEVSFGILPGQTVAIVGASGSGKSTLGRLIAGLYEPTSGSISYDGIDIRSYDIDSIRAQLGVVPQNPYLFSGSIRDNIALSRPDLPLDAVIRAARLAQIHEDIMAMPLGYDTVLSEGGMSLSGGQRQRIALARALVNDPVVLLLDEATSALDSVTEYRVREAINSLGCTRILIAQRLSTVLHADQILVLMEGKVVQRGTHSELMAVEGLYSRLFTAQHITSH